MNITPINFVNEKIQQKDKTHDSLLSKEVEKLNEKETNFLLNYVKKSEKPEVWKSVEDYTLFNNLQS